MSPVMRKNRWREVCGGGVKAQQAKADFERLEKGEQEKDTEPMECMPVVLRMRDGLRIYRFNA